MGPKKRLNYDTFMKKVCRRIGFMLYSIGKRKNFRWTVLLSKYLQTGILQNMQRK